MAYILEKIGNTYNLPKKYFTCDAKSDLDGISLIDVPIGSEAYCILEEESYILDSNKQWHKKKIGEDLTGQIQADWNQNDETALDYVKNRPFYTSDPVETVLVEESTITFENNGGIYLGQLDSTFSATIGETYKVSWDGVTYECTCANLGNGLSIGNLYIAGAGSDTGEPFIIVVENSSGIQIGTLDTASSHTISISSRDIQVIKIDPKYLYMPFKPTGKSYLTFSSLSSFTLNATKHWNGILEYFASDRTWTIWDGISTLSAVYDDGEYVLYLRGTGNAIITQGAKWILTGSDIACIGNIENLLDYTTVESGKHPSMAEDCYSHMFYNCTSLTQAPSLPATTLVANCYYCMFYGCANLTQAPSLPATTLADSCYKCMFYGCTGLTQAPSLPATTLVYACYDGMFRDCASLIQAPALPATTLAIDCYNYMFSNCASLIQAPSLPATTLANNCYGYMFRKCTSLIQAPVLPATTLAYACYDSMFQGCANLTKAPSLPATTLADICYQCMFYGCTGLTQAPSLPATTLTTHCYQGMFYNCTSLKLSSTKTDEYTQEYRIPSSGNGTTKKTSLKDMFYSTGGTFTGTPEINTTYYLSSDNMIVRENELATLNGHIGSLIDTAIEKYSDTAECIISSSTPDSTKKFKITVDDSGTLSAIEVI